MMSKEIDCLFVGHNEGDFVEYERNTREMGEHTNAFRDLRFNYIFYNNRPYTAAEIFNLFYMDKGGKSPLSMGEILHPAIAYLGTYLDRRGFTFDYINSFQEEKEMLEKKLTGERILTVAIITTLYVTAYPIIEIIDFIRKYNRKVKIIVGGPFIATQVRTQDPDALEYMFKFVIGADFFVNEPQGEAVLVQLLKAIKNHLPHDQIPNIYYKKDGELHSTTVVKEDNRLAENMVDWRLFAGHVGGYANVRTAISCPFSCAFCGFPQHAGAYQMADTEAIAGELKALDNLGTVKHVHFIDDTFNIPGKRFKEILRMLIKNKFKFKWYSHFRCQFTDRETVELMRESGCEGVFLGIESGNDQVLKNMKKAAAVDKYFKGIELLNEYQILNYGSFIIGFPGETVETVQDTIRFIKESGLNFFRAQLWYCDPITPIWYQKDKYEIQGEGFEWSHLTMDSGSAADLVEEIFMSIDEPVWVPQYNFECDALFRIFPRGFTVEQVKNFLGIFNKGVGEKIKNPRQGKTSFGVIRELERFFQGSNDFVDSTDKLTSLTEKFDAEFDL
jgi:anaerobic magnesium-protoporphyrin IX monomethyl ester cyclase